MTVSVNKTFDKNNIKLRAAITYAKLYGWAILPLHSINSNNGVCTCGNKNCKSVAKHPITKNGVKDATNDLNQITRWWKDLPNANIGIATGKINNFFVLDIDYKNNGHKTLVELESKFGHFPTTLEQKTGNGKHLFFKYPKFQIRNNVGVYEGIDLRGDDGYIVAPPSIHKNGSIYEWHRPTMPLVDAPDWLLNIVKDKKNYNKNKWEQILNGALEGTRNESTASLTGLLLSKDLELKIVTQLILAWNKRFNKPPLTDNEILKVINSISRRHLLRRENNK